MSGSETGVMTSREPFLQKSPIQSQSAIQSLRLNFSADGGSALYKPVATATSPAYQPSVTSAAASGGGAVVPGAAGEGAVMAPVATAGLNMNMGTEPMKKKRGRPRKYGPDGTMALALSPSAPPVTVTSSSVGAFSPPPAPPAPAPPSGGGSASPPPSSTSTKKSRGRPPGSSKKQQLDALGAPGFGFTPHVITVKAGEDVWSKIMSFSQNGPRAVCILSATGAISNVTLRQPATSGGTVTYEGRFEILSLSGSFLLSEIGGQRSRTGGLSVSLSGPDGRVLGGGVAGLLTAACPVQVVVGSFVADGRKESKTANQMDPLSVAPKFDPGSGPTGASSPQSRGTLSESSGGPGSPLNQSTGACNNNNLQGMSSMPWK
ncbi:DNA-binding protein ESCAROLA [Pyrus ussuriensis x Pyrus communis]|uniref:AT-hook motif nuclear-localized protein n=1 Tax=Pyrus ussuriensis x Pyrus communis TaxID=2448454 RepID=A0A5N5HI42_9ROSA|nr:DNA-binding protein ESCAROLA [Pyrus ussuriensis x Pyrus communis]